MKVLFRLATGVLFLPLAWASALGQSADANAKALVAQAEAAVIAKDFEQAILLMRKAVALAPANDLYLAITSDYELKAGKFADGLAHAEQAIKLNGKNGGYYVVAAANAYGEQDVEKTRALTPTLS